MSEALESTFIKVPFESLKRATRERKYAIDELKDILRTLRSLSDQGAEKQEAIHGLEDCLRQLKRLKRKLDDTSVIERDESQRCQARLDHLQSLGKPSPGNHLEWNHKRIDRLLIDYMLRSGYLESAKQLANRAGLDQFTDLHIFDKAQKVLVSLKNRNCTEALAWCSEHSARLRKARSPLEFRLRVQEFIELVRNNTIIDAITYARQHLSTWADQYPAELRQAAALLAFRADTQCQPYAMMFSDDRWTSLVDLFMSELFRLHSLPPASLLEVHLQAGLSALKTPQTDRMILDSSGNNGSNTIGNNNTNSNSRAMIVEREAQRTKKTPTTNTTTTTTTTTTNSTNITKEDPLYLPTFQKLAQGLPLAKHVHSKLVCAITGNIMTEHNPPMALPNGYAYSQEALMDMAEKNDGKVTCPCTGSVYEYKELRRAYVM